MLLIYLSIFNLYKNKIILCLYDNVIMFYDFCCLYIFFLFYCFYFVFLFCYLLFVHLLINQWWLYYLFYHNLCFVLLLLLFIYFWRNFCCSCYCGTVFSVWREMKTHPIKKKKKSFYLFIFLTDNTKMKILSGLLMPRHSFILSFL